MKTAVAHERLALEIVQTLVQQNHFLRKFWA